jgi:ribose 5-phosphate isomerase RpiB
MRIAVINETSAADKNLDIIKALEGRGHEVLNVGMKSRGAAPELSYIHTGFISALLLNLGCADMVVGGCGTGQGFLNSVVQYPGVFCGHILSPLDAWLFSRINGGNCISLALNQGYGWAGEVNLRFIFDRLFEGERGCGYPESRREPQAASRRLLVEVSRAAHRTMPQVVEELPAEVAVPALSYPGVLELALAALRADPQMRAAVSGRLGKDI